MNRDDIDLLVEQIRAIILNKPLTEDLKSESEELADLQEAVSYLSNCLAESNEFLRHLRMGELDVKPPSRHNFLAGNLKELHSALKHLTWQANQVANGDYSQSVDFLGDFSTSFNKMIRQLAERESQLKVQSEILTETLEMMKSVMDGLREWVVVTSQENGEVIYTNLAAQKFYQEMGESEHACKSHLDMMSYLQSYREDRYESRVFEYQCDIRKKTFQICSYPIHWREKLAYAHLISDVTSERAHREQMEELAYLDALTGLHNRRYCLEQLEKLLDQRTEFTFCMIDLDSLKYANDNFGHAAGDEYLKTVAQEMRKLTRSTDIICRIGGDEFAAIFPNCQAQVVLDKMDHLDQTMVELSRDFPMSVSYGVVHVSQGALITSAAVMEQADEKMYILKNMKKAARISRRGFAMTFTWSADLETGNAQIDAEHQELIQACNRLLTACAAGRGRAELGQTVDFLSQYTKTHFRHEEALQLQSNYPDFANHQQLHAGFIRTVEKLAARLKEEGPTVQLVGEFNKQLGGWLINHIKSEDAKVARHIQSQNVF